jgi:hypothetical protein
VLAGQAFLYNIRFQGVCPCSLTPIKRDKQVCEIIYCRKRAEDNY